MKFVSKRELFIECWNLFKQHSKFLINIGILLFTFQHVLPILIGSMISEYSPMYFFFHFSFLGITTTISIWVIVQMLKIIRDDSTDSLMNVFRYYPKVIRAISGSLIITLAIIMMGVFLIIILSYALGIELDTVNSDQIGKSISSSSILSMIILIYLVVSSYLWVKAYFFIYYIIDRDMKVIESIKTSLIATNGYEADLFIIWISTVALNFLGIILYGLGLIFTLPFAMLILTSFYNQFLCSEAT